MSTDHLNQNPDADYMVDDFTPIAGAERRLLPANISVTSLTGTTWRRLKHEARSRGLTFDPSQITWNAWGVGFANAGVSDPTRTGGRGQVSIKYTLANFGWNYVSHGVSQTFLSGPQKVLSDVPASTLGCK